MAPAGFPATDASGGDLTALQSGTAAQLDAGPAGSIQLGDPAPANDAALVPTPQTQQPAALDPRAVDRIDLSAVAADGLSSEAGRLNVPSGHGVRLLYC